jgi:hypothetical protein
VVKDGWTYQGKKRNKMCMYKVDIKDDLETHARNRVSVYAKAIFNLKSCIDQRY